MSHSPNPVTGSKRKRSPEAGDAGSPIIHLQLTNNNGTPDTGDGDDPAPPFTVPIAMSVAMQNSALLQQLLDDVTEDDMAAGEGIVLPLGGVPDAATLRRVVTLFEKFSEDFDEHTKRVCKEPFKADTIARCPDYPFESDFTEWELDFFSGIIAEDCCCTSLLRLLQAADYLICGAMIKVVAAYIAALISTRTRGIAGGRSLRSAPPEMVFPTKENAADPFAPEHISPHVVAHIVVCMVCTVRTPSFPTRSTVHMDIIMRNAKIFPSFIQAAALAHGIWKKHGVDLDLSNLIKQPLQLQVIVARLRVDPQTTVSIGQQDPIAHDDKDETPDLLKLLSENCQFLRDAKRVTVWIPLHIKASNPRARFFATALSRLWNVEELTIKGYPHRCFHFEEECHVPISELVGSLPALKKLVLTNIVLRDKLEDIGNLKELVLDDAAVLYPIPDWIDIADLGIADEDDQGFVPPELPRNLVTLTINLSTATLAEHIPTILNDTMMRAALEKCKTLKTVDVHTDYTAFADVMRGFEMEKVKIHPLMPST